MRFELGFGAQDDNGVNGVQDLVRNGLGALAGDVDTQFSQGLQGLRIEGTARFGAG